MSEAEGEPQAKPQQAKKSVKKNVPLKTPKGTRDYHPLDMKIREEVIDTVKQCFKRHGAVTIATPVFELMSTLTEKYGEDSKLIYELQDQGGELSALRYDLTVPFARYVAQHGIQQIKRYHIGRVYRRDQPSFKTGRYREFFQCDFDIAGANYAPMLPDAECVALMGEILTKVLGPTRTARKSASPKGENPENPENPPLFKIKVNHRGLLDGMFAIVGIPPGDFRTACSSVDKLDKMSWEDVRKEMVEEKHLDPVAVDKIHDFVVHKGDAQALLASVRTLKLFDASESAMAALAQMEQLFKYCEAFGCLSSISFDLSLARGLDYYNGVIYEAVLCDGKLHLGSLGGGGRYDGLVGMFHKKGKQVPCVGFSIGIERLFALLEARMAAKAKADKAAGKVASGKPVRVSETDVLVAQIDHGLLLDRMSLVGKLWEAGVKAEIVQKENPKIQQQLKYAQENRIPFALVFGSSEKAENKVNLKNMRTSEQVALSMDDFEGFVKDLKAAIAAESLVDE